MTLLDGKTTSQKILTRLAGQFKPATGLAIILVGDSPASLAYIAQKQKIGQNLGINVQVHRLPATTNTVTLLNLIHRLNQDSQVTALMLQLPLPPHLNTASALKAIDPAKDADGLSPTNLGLLFQGHPKAIPSATPAGILALLQRYQIPLAGKNAVIINRRPVLGLPLTALLLAADATVTICHSQTKELVSTCRRADILISAANQPGLITSQFVKQGAVVIDVGYPQPDVNFDQVAPLCSHITPVPGGVGPMTIASLFQNILKICHQNESKRNKNAQYAHPSNSFNQSS